MNWQQFLDSLPAGGAAVSKRAIEDLLSQLSSSGSEFLKGLAGDLERYLNELASGEISKDEFAVLVADSISLEKIDEAGVEISERVLVQKFTDQAKTILISGLSKIL